MKKPYYLLLMITTCLILHPAICENTIDEAKDLSDSISLKGSELQQNHTLSTPYILYPKEGQVVNGTVCVKWTEAIDSDGHSVRYSFLTSHDGLRWKLEASDIEETYFYWDTEAIWYEYHIKVEAKCSIGSISSDSIEIVVENYSPELKFLLILLLFLIIFLLLIGIIVYRKRSRMSPIKAIPSIKDPKTIKLGLCLGSFTDKGLSIKGMNTNCPFSPEQIEPILEYSAALFQHGKTDTMYGPIPITSLKEELPEIESSQTHWCFVTYWMKVMDSSVEDPRIKKLGGVVSAVILFFYPKQIDNMVMVKKKNISEIFNSLISSDTDISEFTIDTLNKIEEYMIKLFIS
ncbi:MAG: hypothetical protein ACFFDC_10585 [Promethearchaeota archaeon]